MSIGYHNGRPLTLKPSRLDGSELHYKSLLQSTLLTEVPDPGGVIDFEKQCPTAQDQGQKGACYAFAGCNMKGYQEIVQGDYPAGGFSKAYIVNKCKQIDGMPDQEGSTLKALMTVLATNGVCLESSLPYALLEACEGAKYPAVTKAMDTEALKYRIKSPAQVLSGADTNRNNATYLIRQALLQKGPFPIGIQVFSSFEPDKNGIIPVPGKDYDTWRGGHAVLCIGHDPDKGVKILNSWGTGWGIRGCAYLAPGWESGYYDPVGNGAKSWFFMEGWTSLDIDGSGALPVPDKQPERTTIILTADSDIMIVNGVEQQLDQAAFIMADTGRMMVPVRAPFEAVGATITYNADTRSAMIVFEK